MGSLFCSPSLPPFPQCSLSMNPAHSTCPRGLHFPGSKGDDIYSFPHNGPAHPRPMSNPWGKQKSRCQSNLAMYSTVGLTTVLHFLQPVLVHGSTKKRASLFELTLYSPRFQSHTTALALRPPPLTSPRLPPLPRFKKVRACALIFLPLPPPLMHKDHPPFLAPHVQV